MVWQDHPCLYNSLQPPDSCLVSHLKRITSAQNNIRINDIRINQRQEIEDT
ncbi:hypothetical protein Q7O_002429 [Pectobacterium carotovorum subsp. carotovorum PCCS1]|nr:hypothetical protein [Pectobacterium carotovorum subsp. carotovorum PCCS1]